MPTFLFSSIIRHFFPKATDIQVKPLGNGHINTSYEVAFECESSVRKVVLQKLNTQIFNSPIAIAENIESVANFLRAKKYRYQILSLLKTSDGDFHHIDNENQYWRIMPYFSDSYTIEKCENVSEAFVAAQAFGHFFSILSDFPNNTLHTIIPRFHDATWRWEQFEMACQQAKPRRLAMAKEELDFCEKNKYLIEKYANIIHQLPQRVTHNDTKISNILFDKNTKNPLAIIDLDTLQMGTILSEFGDMVRSYCSTATEDEQWEQKIMFRKDIYDALRKGFLSEAKTVLTEEEIMQMAFGAQLTVFVQGLRFLSDFLNNDTYYTTKYATHNLVRARNQFILLSKMFL